MDLHSYQIIIIDKSVTHYLEYLAFYMVINDTMVGILHSFNWKFYSYRQIPTKMCENRRLGELCEREDDGKQGSVVFSKLAFTSWPHRPLYRGCV